MELDYWEALMGEEVEEVAYHGVWVVAEVEGGSLSPTTLEVLGKGRELADRLGAYLEAVLMGEGVGDLAQELIRYGADTVYLADDPRLAEYHVETYTKVLADLVEGKRPEILLMGATDLGRDLAPRLAQRLGAGLITGCVEVDLDEAEGLLLATHGLYGDEYFHTVVCPQARPQMATLRPGYFRPAYPDEYRTGEVEAVSVELEGVEPRVRVLRELPAEARREVPLPKARIIVSGGRGMGDEEGFALLEKLAEALGGVVAGSRGAVDEGWIGQERQVGIGGAIVRPDLYIACGISGAIQHYIGMQDAKFVVAINKDPNAPIFQVADIGVVGDAREVIPALIEALQEEG